MRGKDVSPGEVPGREGGKEGRVRGGSLEFAEKILCRLCYPEGSLAYRAGRHIKVFFFFFAGHFLVFRV